jgi:hypothetical protein
MTTPVFLETDETAFDTDRALTAEHGRRLIRNALAIYNERCGHVGYSERLVGADGAALTTRKIVTANFAYHGPINYYCPAPVGQPNQARQIPYVRLLLTGRATGLATSIIYAINSQLNTPLESVMLEDYTTSPSAAAITTADWSVSLEVPVRPGWNKIWIAFLCGPYGEIVDIKKGEGAGAKHPFLCALSNDNDPYTPSHPAVLGTQVLNFMNGLDVAVTIAPINGTDGTTYTCPRIEENVGKSASLDDGVFYLWEPFIGELEGTGGTILASNNESPYIPVPGSVAPPRPIKATYRQIDVINLDSLTVDGSQVWQLEDNDGAGLRWWQLPSALQYRQAANLAESARRAVCPMVSVGGEVTRPVTPIPYPDITGEKPYGWIISNQVGRGSQYALLSLNSLPPFQIPTDTVTLEYCFDMCLINILIYPEDDTFSVIVSCAIGNIATNTAIINNTTEIPILDTKVKAGGVEAGYSVLARTVAYGLAYNRHPNARCTYKTEGLTRRADFGRWQEMRGTISVPRALLPSDPVALFTNVALHKNGAPISSQRYFYTAQSQLSVRIVGQ